MESSGLAPAEYGPFDYDPDEGLAGVEVMLKPGGSVRGRVLDGDGLRQRHVVLLSRGDGVVRTVRTDLDGDYLFDHVTPGPCFLRVVPEMIFSGVGSSNSTLGLPYRTIEGDVVVAEGLSTLHDLTTGRAQPRAMLRGQVGLRGPESTRWVALLQPDESGIDDGGLIEEVRLGADGRFEAAGGAPGRYVLLLTDAKGDEDEHAIRIAVPLDLSAGTNEWRLDLAFGEVRTGPFADPESETLLWRGPKGAFAIASLAPEGELRRFLAGEVCRVPTPQILRPDALGQLSHLDPLETIQLPAKGVVLVGD